MRRARPTGVLLLGLGAGLGLFHLQLLWARLSEGALLRPGVALRWGLGLLAVAGFLQLRRRQVPLIRGRRALGLWTLVLLLHWSAASDPAGVGRPSPEFLVPLPVTITLAAALLATSLLGTPTASRPLVPLAALAAARADLPRGGAALLPSRPRPPPPAR